MFDMGIEGEPDPKKNTKKGGLIEKIPKIPEAFLKVWGPTEQSALKVLHNLIEVRNALLAGQKADYIYDATKRAVGGIGFSIGAPLTTIWYGLEEQGIKDDIRAHGITFEEFGNPESPQVLMFLPGQFDPNIHERVNKISKLKIVRPLKALEHMFDTHGGIDQKLLERMIETQGIIDKRDNDTEDEEDEEDEADLGPHRIIIADTLYSARRLEKIQEILTETEAHARTLLDEDPKSTLILIGYSFGGLMGKELADRLSKDYPNRIGLVAHNSPFNPDKGEFVKYAKLKDVHRAVGFSPVYDGSLFPAYLLAGKYDWISPRDSGLITKDGKEILPKNIPSKHTDPCHSPIATRYIRAAIRRIQSRLNQGPPFE